MEGTVEAEDVRKAVESLRARSLYVVEVREPGQGLRREVRLSDLLAARPGLKDVAVLARQLATMLGAGVTLLQALAILEEQTNKRSLSAIVQKVRRDVEEGASFADALGKHPIFSRLFVSLVRTGEVSGNMDGVLDRVAGYMEKELAIRSKVRSAMTYPTVVFVFAVLVTYFLLAVVVPQFGAILSDIGGELPLTTRLLLALSEFLRAGFPFFLVGGVAGVFAFRLGLRNPAFRGRVDWLKLRFPVFGPLVHKNILASTLRTLATLMRSGVSILEALSITREVAGNVHFKRALDTARRHVERGEGLAGAFLQHREVFPPMVGSMVAIGEETGETDSLLVKVAEYYEREVEDTVAALASLIEPLLIVFLGVVVGFIVLALFLPIVQVIQTIGNW